MEGAKIFDKNFSQTGVQLSVGSACCTPPSVVHKTHVCSKLSCCSKFYIYFIGAADQEVPCAVLLNQRNSEMAGANARFFARFSIEIGLFLGGHTGRHLTAIPANPKLEKCSRMSDCLFVCSCSCLFPSSQSTSPKLKASRPDKILDQTVMELFTNICSLNSFS